MSRGSQDDKVRPNFPSHFRPHSRAAPACRHASYALWAGPAVRRARAAAGDNDIDVFSPSIGNQLLPGPARLEPIGVEQTSEAAPLRYRVASAAN